MLQRTSGPLVMLTDALLRQRGHLLCWVPVFLGIGIGWYFALKTEPGLLFWSSLVIVICALIIAAGVVHIGWAPVVLALPFAWISGRANWFGLHAWIAAPLAGAGAWWLIRRITRERLKPIDENPVSRAVNVW